jgi:hypothetical protein
MTSAVVALTLTNETMGVMARRAAAVQGEVDADAAFGRCARKSRSQWGCAANEARIVLQSGNKLLISLMRDRRSFAANLLFSLQTS